MSPAPLGGDESPGAVVQTAEDIRSVKLRQLWRYWRSLHKNGTMPSRRDIDPLQIPLLLPYVMLVEALPGTEDFRYRLVGTHIARIHGTDNTGKCVSECFAPHERAQVTVLFQRTVRERCVIAHRGRPRRRDNRMLDYEIVHMPLVDGQDQANMVFVGLEFTLTRCDQADFPGETLAHDGDLISAPSGSHASARQYLLQDEEVAMTTLPDNVTRLRPQPPASPRPPGEDPMLFWAERDPAAVRRSVVMTLLLMSPLAFLVPAAFIVAALGAFLAAALNTRYFRFHLSARELSLRAAALSPTLRVPLADIAEASALPDPGGFLAPLAPRSGHLLIKKTDGSQLVVPGLKDVAEVVDAIRRLKAPPAEAAAA